MSHVSSLTSFLLCLTFVSCNSVADYSEPAPFTLPVYDEKADTTHLFVVKDGDHYGFIDVHGNQVIGAIYDFAGNFREGRAHVTLGGSLDAIIDKKGTIVYQGSERQIVALYASDGLIGISDVVDNYRKHGFLDLNGKLVIPYSFDNARDFKRGYAPVCMYTDPFSEDERLEVPDKEKDRLSRWGLIDRRGKLVVPFLYADIDPFSDGLALVKDVGGLYGFVDTLGKVVIPLQYTKAQSFQEGKAAVEVNGKWGFIDRTGKMVIAPAYNSTWGFSEGYANVTNEAGNYGYIDAKGQLVIGYRFEFGIEFYEGKAMVKSYGKYGCINRSGEWLIRPESEEYMYYGQGLWTSTINGKTGFVDSTGQWVIPPQFADAMNFENGLAQVVSRGTRRGYWSEQQTEYINITGRIVWDHYH